jgi:four helix bundle protein
MESEDLKRRTKAFGLRVIRLAESLPKGRVADVIGRQLLRSGTSVGAQYRSACRAKSKADFISKINNVEEEADESAYWIELLADANYVVPHRVAGLHQEAEELTKIFAASGRTAKRNR